ncbi:unnamed protein product [Protopolystoma xenopodis]|uniref:Uncharacterized protein n=1 Tax=Protopolystoma xenopodis TaxID=117903 RepID=A0A3S5A195_9PLAT|nr:unnamed protein product [Protopolystoma xenopodis]
MSCHPCHPSCASCTSSNASSCLTCSSPANCLWLEDIEGNADSNSEIDSDSDVEAESESGGLCGVHGCLTQSASETGNLELSIHGSCIPCCPSYRIFDTHQPVDCMFCLSGQTTCLTWKDVDGGELSSPTSVNDDKGPHDLPLGGPGTGIRSGRLHRLIDWLSARPSRLALLIVSGIFALLAFLFISLHLYLANRLRNCLPRSGHRSGVNAVSNSGQSGGQESIELQHSPVRRLRSHCLSQYSLDLDKRRSRVGKAIPVTSELAPTSLAQAFSGDSEAAASSTSINLSKSHKAWRHISPRCINLFHSSSLSCDQKLVPNAATVEAAAIATSGYVVSGPRESVLSQPTSDSEENESMSGGRDAINNWGGSGGNIGSLAATRHWKVLPDSRHPQVVYMPADQKTFSEEDEEDEEEDIAIRRPLNTSGT